MAGSETRKSNQSESAELVETKEALYSGGDLLVRALSESGVKQVFGYPGGAALHIYDALFRQDDIEHVLVRHEQAATHMADGYARHTGEAGVVLVTSGPGATNAVTGLATAYMDSIPMVVLSGQVATMDIGTDAFQETDMVGVSRPIVKHSFMIKDPLEIPEIVKKAFYIATTGRPGPVVIDIPKNLTDPNQKFPYRCPDKIKMRSYSPTKKGHKGQIKKAVECLFEAKKPVVYAGGGIIQGNAHELLTKLVKTYNLPVTNTLMGLGAYPGDGEHFLGMLGMHGTYQANMAMHNSDLILALGARFDDRITNTVERFCPNAKIVHVDVDPATISKIIEAHVPIVGRADLVLKDMLSIMKGADKTFDKEALGAWWDQINVWRKRDSLAYEKSEDGTIKPQQVVETLYEVTKGEAVVCSDVGQHQMFAALYYPYKYPRQWINSGGLGTMGFGLPAAMGVAYTNRKADVVCVTGEGSIQMNIQELSTCSQYNLPVKIININNHALGMVRQWQDMQYGGRYSASTYSDSLPDFVKLAEAYGHVGIKVTHVDELRPALEKAFSLKDKLVFVDVYVDPNEHVYPMLIKPGSLADMMLSKTERT